MIETKSGLMAMLDGLPDKPVKVIVDGKQRDIALVGTDQKIVHIKLMKE